MPVRTPSKLPFPAYLLNFPFTVNNNCINNVLMEPYSGEKYNYSIAFKQFMGLYNYLAKDNLVYLLPSKGNYQDQVFVANLGCYLPHSDLMLVSNFTSEPRQGEDKIGLEFLSMMGYTVLQPRTKFEGEADLKYLRDNLFIGGYGIRTDKGTYSLIQDVSDTNVVTIEMNDPKLYHFDCMFLPLTTHKALVATRAIKPNDLRKIERLVEVIDVPGDHLYDAWTNCVVLGNKVLYGPATPELGKEFSYFIEKHDFEPVTIDLSEFEKSGAALSCMVLHLNYIGARR